jgi:hypothetical protein
MKLLKVQATDPVAVRAQVSRILASPRFASSERLSRFLTFVSEEAVQGRGDQIKEYVIGTAVYDKPAATNPAPIPLYAAKRLSSAPVCASTTLPMVATMLS